MQVYSYALCKVSSAQFLIKRNLNNNACTHLDMAYFEPKERGILMELDI